MSQPLVGAIQVYSDDNPFASRQQSSNNYFQPGSHMWWLDRLLGKLIDRYDRYNTLENYALGFHPLPNTDYRYAKALAELQRKARTNYCEMVIKATTERMKVKGFRFGPVGQADEDAKKIWDYNDMDYQSVINVNTAGTFGLCYGLVAPPDPRDPDAVSSITIEDPRMCVVERHPTKITKSIAGLKVWQDDILEAVVAVLYLPDYIFTYTAYNFESDFEKDAFLTRQFHSAPAAASFTLRNAQPNVLGEVPLVEGNWQPAFGELGRAEHEGILDIQDRINHTVLDRLIISKTQAYRQRWATGVNSGGKKGSKKPPFDPGADVLWVTANPDAKFGDFDTADIMKIQEVIERDVGHIAAVTQTPATYLMNRMVNVSGDTLTQDQVGLVSKVKTRMDAMGWFYERLMKLAFKFSGNEKWKTTEASTLWSDPEVRTLAEQADAIGKFVAAGLPIEIVLEKFNFSPDEIAFAKEAIDEQQRKAEEREDAIAARDHTNAIEMEKAKPKPSSTTTR